MQSSRIKGKTKSFFYGSSLAFMPDLDSTHSETILHRNDSIAIATDMQKTMTDLANSLSQFMGKNG